VEETVTLQAALGVELLEPRRELLVGLGAHEFPGHVVERFGKALPRLRLGMAARELVEPRMNLVRELLARVRRARHAQRGEMVGERAADREVVERRHELAARQVAARPEHHERARRGLTPRPTRRLRQDGLDARGGHGRASFTAWPPNSLRSAASTLSRN